MIYGTDSVVLGNTGSDSISKVAPGKVSVSFSPLTAQTMNAASTLQVKINYFNAVSINLSAGDFSWTGDDGASCALTISGSGLAERVVTLSACAGRGTSALQLKAGTALGTDGSSESVGAISEEITINALAITGSLTKASGQLSTTSDREANFKLVTSDAIEVGSFTSADISNQGSAAVGSWSISNPTGDGKTFSIVAEEVVGAGSITPLIGPNALSSNAGNMNTAAIGSGATVTHTESTATVSFDITTTEMNEGNALTPVTLGVTMSEAKDYDVKIALLLNDEYSTATPLTDHSLASQELTIPAGQTTVSFTFNIIGDSVADDSGPKFIYLSLIASNSNSVSMGGKSVHRITIHDDDGGRDPFAKISMGISHHCGVTQSGLLKCWGMGKLGDGVDYTETYQKTPITIGSGYASVSVAWDYSCAIKITGELYCWGKSRSAHLGAAGMESSLVPVQIDAANLYDSVSVGEYHSCGILKPNPSGSTGGALKCWGDIPQSAGGGFRIGNGMGDGEAVPVVVDSGQRYLKVSVSKNNSCAIRDSGNVYCWGASAGGFISGGSGVRSLPTLIDNSDAYTDVAVRDFDGSRACGTLVGGGFKCWGANSAGGMSLTGTTMRDFPDQVVDAGTVYTQVSVGYVHQCLLTATQTVKCFGINTLGATGEPTATYVSGNLITVDSGTSYAFISVNENGSCGITVAGATKCWGGDIGEESGSTFQSRPTEMPLSDVTKGALGYGMGCFIKSTGALSCAGWQRFSQLGLGTSEINQPVPGTVMPGTRFIDVSISYGPHTCAISDQNLLYCWGKNDGRTYASDAISRATPFRIGLSSDRFKKVKASQGANCALTIAGVLKCWGTNNQGAVGNGLTTRVSQPTAIDSGVKYVEVAMGEYSGCGITEAGVLKCWGSGLIGTGADESQSLPVVVDNGVLYEKISLSFVHQCGITKDKVLKCWGSNDHGQVGNNSAADQPTPVVVDEGTSYQQVAAGTWHSCGLTADGSLKCWGYIFLGNYRPYETVFEPVPKEVDPGEQYSNIWAGRDGNVCGVTSSGKLKCMGQNYFGLLGKGSFSATHGLSVIW